MNIFFYPASVSKQTFVYYKKLQSAVAVKELVLLPGGCGLSSKPCLGLRSGDILILYAESREGVDKLLGMEEDLRGYRLLLLLEAAIMQQEQKRICRLNPIFTAIPSEMSQLSMVLLNILCQHDKQVAAASEPAYGVPV